MIYYKIRLSKIFTFFFNWIFKRTLEVPEESTFLVYQGYDSEIFFHKKDGEIKIIRKRGKQYVREDFKGLPIHYDFSLNYIPNKKPLIKILRIHLEKLLDNKISIHGDLTHYNILVNNKKHVSIIDSKPNPNYTSILTDFFYFYSYFLLRSKLNKIFYHKQSFLLEKELLDIYKEVFKNSDIEMIEEIKKIRKDSFHASKKESVFIYYKTKFKEFMEDVMRTESN